MLCLKIHMLSAEMLFIFTSWPPLYISIYLTHASRSLDSSGSLLCITDGVLTSKVLADVYNKANGRFMKLSVDL